MDGETAERDAGLPSRAIRQRMALDAPGSASRRLVVSVIGAAVVVVLAAAVIVPFGSVRLPEYPGFIWAYVAVFVAVDTLTAALLARTAVFTASRPVGVLSAAYVFAAVMAGVFFVAFPGALATGGALGGAQSAVWLYYLWRLGFLGLVALSALTLIRPGPARPITRRWLALTQGAAVLAAAAIAGVVLGAPESLPVLLAIQPEGLTTTGLFPWVSALTLVIGLVALALTVRAARDGSRLRWWLILVTVIYCADVAVQMTTTSRYELGWYAPRIFSLVGAVVLLVLLVNEVSMQYRALSLSLERQDAMWLALHTRITDLDHRSSHDDLTGLLNRPSFEEHLAEMLAGCPPDRHVGVLYLDLDHFKEINDTFTHDAGDAALRTTAEILVGSVRSDDRVARMGGDEFVVAVSRAHGLEDVVRIAAELVSVIGGLAVRIGDRIVPMSASVGVSLSRPDVTADQLIHEADVALYTAKRNGRNRFEVFPSGPEAPRIALPAARSRGDRSPVTSGSDVVAAPEPAHPKPGAAPG